MITIQQPKVIANEQKFIFDECHIVGGEKKDLKAILCFLVLNENNERIDTVVIEYSGEDYNTFWQNFNSGKFVYEQLISKQEMPLEVDNSVESDFLN